MTMGSGRSAGPDPEHCDAKEFGATGLFTQSGSRDRDVGGVGMPSTVNEAHIRSLESGARRSRVW